MGNWPLLESMKEYGEHPASLEICSQPTSLHDAGNSPPFSFTCLFHSMTSTLSPMMYHWERPVLLSQ